MVDKTTPKTKKMKNTNPTEHENGNELRYSSSVGNSSSGRGPGGSMS